MDIKRKETVSKLALLFTTIIWSSTFTVVKMMMGKIGPVLLIAIRFTVAAVVLGAVFHKNLKKINRHSLLAGIKIGICLFLAYVVQTIGIAEGEPGRTAFLSALYCVIVPFMMWGLNGMRPTGSNIAAAVFCFLGIGFVSYSGASSGGISLGDVLAISSGFLFAAHISSVAAFGIGNDPIVITVVQMSVAAIGSWILFPLMEDPSAVIIDRSVIIQLAYISLICTCLALTLQNVGQQHCPAGAAAIIYALEAVFSVIFSAIFYGEDFTLHAIIGFCIIFVGLVISEYRPGASKKAK